MASAVEKVRGSLKSFALQYPESTEAFPWGEWVVKVRGKVFVFLGVPGGALHVTVKLPTSGSLALGLPFTQPTGYGLGKSGWITATFTGGQRPPLVVLKSWIDESYRAVAPRALVGGATLPRQAGKDLKKDPRHAGSGGASRRRTSARRRRGPRSAGPRR